jgi:hypothetical protein
MAGNCYRSSMLLLNSQVCSASRAVPGSCQAERELVLWSRDSRRVRVTPASLAEKGTRLRRHVKSSDERRFVTGPVGGRKGPGGARPSECRQE